MGTWVISEETVNRDTMMKLTRTQEKSKNQSKKTISITTLIPSYYTQHARGITAWSLGDWWGASHAFWPSTARHLCTGLTSLKDCLRGSCFHHRFCKQQPVKSSMSWKSQWWNWLWDRAHHKFRCLSQRSQMSSSLGWTFCKLTTLW